MSQSSVILVTLIGYKLLLIGIGFWASRRVHDPTDFFVGGRNLGPWVAGLSYAASTSSAWVILGYSGFVFATGLSALWMLPGIWGGYVAVWLWLGPKLRAEASENQLITATDFMCRHIEPRAAQRIAAVAALLIVFCFVFYIAAQFDAAADAFSSNFSLDVTSSVLIGATIVVVYSLLGGFWAVSVTDMLQGIVMMLAALIVPAFAVHEAGGFGAVLATLGASDSGNWFSVTGGRSGWFFAGFVLGVMSIGLGTLGQPHLLARLMAVRGERERKQGFAIAMTWAVVVFLSMSALALAARSMNLQPAANDELFYLAATRFLPPVLAGVVLAAVLSAVMSTVDSLLLAAAAAVAHDLGLARRFVGRELLISRVVMIAIAVAAVILTLTLPDTIFNRVLFAWSALGAAFGPVLVARVVGVEPGATTRLMSILVGFGLTVLFYSYGNSTATDGLGGFLAHIAQLPGDPFERLFPWLPALAIVFFGPRQSASGATNRLLSPRQQSR